MHHVAPKAERPLMTRDDKRVGSGMNTAATSAPATSIRRFINGRLTKDPSISVTSTAIVAVHFAVAGMWTTIASLWLSRVIVHVPR